MAPARPPRDRTQRAVGLAGGRTQVQLLVEVFAAEMDRLSEDLERVYEDAFIETEEDPNPLRLVVALRCINAAASPGPSYLDLWQRSITPLEDLDLGEAALPGPEAAPRLRAWEEQVQALPERPAPKPLTRRERAWELLQQREEGWSPRELAEALGTTEGVVMEDLRHLQRSAKRSDRALHMLPTKCRGCGWVGRAEEARRPTKCPRCKSQELHPPRFRVAPR